jgi:hypothetical protein
LQVQFVGFFDNINAVFGFGLNIGLNKLLVSL